MSCRKDCVERRSRAANDNFTRAGFPGGLGVRHTLAWWLSVIVPGRFLRLLLSRDMSVSQAFRPLSALLRHVTLARLRPIHLWTWADIAEFPCICYATSLCKCICFSFHLGNGEGGIRTLGSFLAARARDRHARAGGRF